MKSPHHRPRLHQIKIFQGSIEMDELHARGARLHVPRGCERRTIDKEGERVGETYESGAALWANKEDRVLLMGPAMHEIAVAKVVTVYPSGDRMYVSVVTGTIEMTTTRVKVLPCKVGGVK